MKRRILRSLAAISIAASLAGCQTPTVYGPAASTNAVGYSETQIDTSHWRVTFRGGSDADFVRVGDLALRRSAELTLAQGYDWFSVTDRYTQSHGGGGPVISLGVGGTSFGRGSAIGVGGETGFNLGGGPAVSRSLEIEMGKGPAPRGPDVYDAHVVVQTLGPHA